MSFAFDPLQGLVIVRAEIFGPAGWGFAHLALDTGATTTLISAAVLVGLGYDPSAATTLVPVTTGSGVAYAPRIPVDKLIALGEERMSFPVLCHTLPPSAGIDGLLGLDFLRGRTLLVDFKAGQVTVR